MRMVLCGINYYPEPTGIGKYSGEMVKWLSHKEHEIQVVTAPPYYPEWKIRDGYSAWRYRKYIHGKTVIFRVPLYIPMRPTTVTRLVHLISFAITSFPVVVGRLTFKPNIVLLVQPTIFASLGALLLAKVSGAKSVMHIQDYEIDAMLGLGMLKNGFLATTLRKYERWIMNRFDAVSTISQGMKENAMRKGIPESKLLLFPNWAELDYISPDIDGSILKANWGFSEADKIILYSGNIGVKQGLELVLDVAERLRGNHLYKFLIVGAGAKSEQIKADASNRGLENVHCKPLQPWDRVPEMLSMADVHLVIQKRGAADVVLPSKVTNILSAGGHALVTAEEHTELGRLAQRFPGIYTCIDPEDPDLLVKALTALLRTDLTKPNQIARDYALEYLAQDTILSRFEKDLVNLAGQDSL